MISDCVFIQHRDEILISTNDLLDDIWSILLSTVIIKKISNRKKELLVNMMINATLTITERLGLTAGFETERNKTLRRAESSLKDTAEFDQISCNFPWSDNRLYTTFLTTYMPCHLQTGLLPLTS